MTVIILVSWLNNWVDTSSLSINELTDIFESLGFEIEEVKNISPNYKNVCIGTVKHIESIKNAEKIRQIDQIHPTPLFGVSRWGHFISIFGTKSER